MGKNIKITDEPRRRGRPAGRNRIPLSREERRARNAQYERERRTEYAEAMAELAESVGCDIKTITNADLLATVVNLLGQSYKNPDENVASLRRTNNEIMSQIQSLEQRLLTEPAHPAHSAPGRSQNRRNTTQSSHLDRTLPSGSHIESRAPQVECPAACVPDGLKAEPSSDDDGVLDYMRQCSVEDFIQTYL